jgi:glycosyltransferase involved in cell wall biosynthesis
MPAALLHIPGTPVHAIELPPSPPPAASPLVSCLMVSRGRLFPARHAVRCFLRQTHPNRELVIVIDDPGCDLRAYVLALADPRLRLVEIDSGQRTLGELRNIAVANARGEYVCQWDDDDLYAPRRIEVQLAALVATGAAACLLRRWTLWWPEARRLAISGARTWEGSILARARDLPPYPALRRGEDTEMIEALLARERVVSLDAPELYVYIRHGENTFGLAHFTGLYNYSRRRWTGERCDAELARLAASLPIRTYEADLAQLARTGTGSSRGADPVPPLVSIVVRSVGRPTLAAALESLAAQDHPALEVIVVDATGGAHPPLPALAWPPGHSLRLVAGGRPLPRPQAANVGLDAVRGEWFGFLDDDDTFDPDHVSTLLALGATTDDLAVYGMSRLLDAEGETTEQLGMPFNREAIFIAPLCSFPAALFRREVIERGCRFDEALEIFEDQDFFRQVSLISDFSRSDVATFNYHIEAGTSGTGRGANRAWVRSPQFHERLSAKWAGPATYHAKRVQAQIRRAARAFHLQADPRRARALLEALLQAYPDEPNALNALGSIGLAAGDLSEAEAHLRRAVEINSTAGEYRYHLGCVLHRAGRLSEALRELRAAVADARVEPAMRAAALRLLGSAPRSAPWPAAQAGAGSGGELSRAGLCPCGSGKRYKHCCGRLSAPPPESPADVAAKRALSAFASGEADAAMAMLDATALAELTAAATVFSCAELLREMGRYERACEFLAHAAALGETLRASGAAGVCCASWYRPQRDASLLATARELIELFNARRRDGTAGSGDRTIHVVGAFGKIGGSEHRAYGLHALLSPHAAVRLWSTVPPLPELLSWLPIETIDAARGVFPAAGHLVFVGVYFDWGDWLEKSRPSRVTIAYNTDSAEELVTRLVALEDVDPGFVLDLTVPSRSFRDAYAIPGVVEVAPVDTARFQPRRARGDEARPLAIGRHSRDDRYKFHPNDPAFFRSLLRDGHRVEIVGGTCLAKALAPEAAAGRIVLRPEIGDVVPFLNGLDVFVYRVHPQLHEAGGTVILEAMAMELPVIVFGERIGNAEFIEHGVNGFLVDSEAQARSLVRDLHHDPCLRRAVGAAARATIVAMMATRRRSLLDFYAPWCDRREG